MWRESGVKLRIEIFINVFIYKYVLMCFLWKFNWIKCIGYFENYLFDNNLIDMEFR